MAIQMRRGAYAEFDPLKMKAGEWAVSTDSDTKKQQMFPTSITGSSSTYYPDGCWFNIAIIAFALFGGPRPGGRPCGAFSVGLNNEAARQRQYLPYINRTKPRSC